MRAVNNKILEIDLLSAGGRVILACRDLKKAEHAKADIVWETGNENVIVKHLDLASMKSIHAFAEDINACKGRLFVPTTICPDITVMAVNWTLMSTRTGDRQFVFNIQRFHQGETNKRSE